MPANLAMPANIVQTNVPGIPIQSTQNGTRGCDACESALPVHDEFSLPRRIISALSIAAAVGLLTISAARIVAAGDTLRWLAPLATVVGMASADLLSGLVHWSADTWGSESMPVVGRRILHPFRVHHVNPNDFLRRRFIDTNGDVALLVVPVIVAALLIPLDSAAQLASAVFVTAFCGVGLLTNQVHQWAHMPKPHWVVRMSQDCGLILSRRAHAQHHQAPYADYYCIATGWCNRPLAAVDFFRRAERAVTWATGWQPRRDDAEFQSAADPHRHDPVAAPLAVEAGPSHA